MKLSTVANILDCKIKKKKVLMGMMGPIQDKVLWELILSPALKKKKRERSSSSDTCGLDLGVLS